MSGIVGRGSGNPAGIPDFTVLIGASYGTGGKICPGCGVWRPWDGFSCHRNKPDGRSSWCKPCVTAVQRERQYGQKPEYKVTRKAYRSRPDVIVRQREQRRYRKATSPRDCLGRGLIHALNRCPTDSPVTVDELMEMYGQQNGLCALSCVKMTWAQGKITGTSMSIDKIDQSGTYTRDNVRLVCYCVNSFRGTMTDQEMLTFAKAIVATMS